MCQPAVETFGVIPCFTRTSIYVDRTLYSTNSHSGFLKYALNVRTLKFNRKEWIKRSVFLLVEISLSGSLINWTRKQFFEVWSITSFCIRQSENLSFQVRWNIPFDNTREFLLYNTSAQCTLDTERIIHEYENKKSGSDYNLSDKTTPVVAFTNSNETGSST